MKSYSLANRLVAGAALWSGLALIVGGLTLASIFRDVVERQFEDRLVVIWESLVSAVDVDEAGGVVPPPALGDLRFEQSFSGWYWQIALKDEGTGDAIGLARSRSLWDQSLSVPEKVSTKAYSRQQVLGPDEQNLQLIARNVVLPGALAQVTIMVAADRREVEGEISRFNTVLIWSFMALGAGLLVAVLIQVRVGLGPLREVRRALAAIRTGDADRLDGDFPSEISPLAEELNGLIKHNADVLERSRTQVGNLAHALKTPLTVLANEVKSNPGPLAETVKRQTQTMKAQTDHYLARARAAATSELIGARTPLKPVTETLSRTLERLYQDKNISIECDLEPALSFRGERQDLEEVLGNLLDNACKWADSRVRLTATLSDMARAKDEAKEARRSFLKITVEDDGPGLSEEQRKAVLPRGARLDEAIPGSGLGLSIVADIVDLYGGQFALNVSSSLGGVCAVLTLPAAKMRIHH